MPAVSYANVIGKWVESVWATTPTPELVAWLDRHLDVWRCLGDAPSAIGAAAGRPVRLRLAVVDGIEGIAVKVAVDGSVEDLMDTVDQIELGWKLELPEPMKRQVWVDYDFD